MVTDKNFDDIFVYYNSINAEPFVNLPGGNDFETHSKEDEIRINQRRRQSEKFRFFMNSFDFLNDSKILGDYFEFGVHKARTFRMALTAAKFYHMDEMYFRAFDSFEGLPDPGYQVTNLWSAGNLATSESEFINFIEQHGLFTDRVECYKGFYENSLTIGLQEELVSKQSKAKMITVDCDFFASAESVFGFIEPFLQHGTVVYLDDVFGGFTNTSKGGVMEAFRRFRGRSKFEFIPHLSVGWWGQSFLTSEL